MSCAVLDRGGAGLYWGYIAGAPRVLLRAGAASESALLGSVRVDALVVRKSVPDGENRCHDVGPRSVASLEHLAGT